MERIIDLPEPDKQTMGSDWIFIGYDQSERLALIPRQPYVIRFKRAKHVPINDDVAGAEQGVVIAPRAPQILPKAIGHSSLIADVVVGKFVDALPLWRQEKIFTREGIDISRQTMAGWMIALDEKLIPLMAGMKAVLFQGPVIHIDETRLQVLGEPGREASQQSYLWVYRGGPPERAIIWFQYAETRSGEVPRELLFPGRVPAPGSDPPSPGLYLLTDGYSSYGALACEVGIRAHAACWAHVRRKFVEAAEGRKNTAAARASATLYSLIETAKANALEPRAYLTFLFERLPEARMPAAIDALLPHNLKAEDLKL